MEMNTSERRVNKDIAEILRPALGEPAFEGTIKEGYECKYVIINLKDLEKYVGMWVQQDLAVILDHVQGNIEHGREQDGKKPFNNYIVINIDEPYINDIVAIMETNGHWDGQPSGKMRFYEIDDPYYALIKAISEEDAVAKYIEVVAGEDDEKEILLEEIEEVSFDYAIIKAARAKSEDGTFPSIEDVLSQLQSGEAEVLVMDGSLY